MSLVQDEIYMSNTIDQSKNKKPPGYDYLIITRF